MKRPPIPPKENLFAGGMIPRILSTAIIMAAISIFIQWWTLDRGYDHKTQQTSVFSILCFMQLANALSVRFMYTLMFSSSIFENKGMWATIALTVALQVLLINVPLLQSIFKTSTLPQPVVFMSLGAILLFVVCIETGKLLTRMKYLPHS